MGDNNMEALISEADMVYSSLKASYYPSTPLSTHYNLFDCNADINAIQFESNDRVNSNQKPEQTQQNPQHLFYQNSNNSNAAYLIGSERSSKEPASVIQPLPQLSINTNFNLPPSSPIFSNITPTFVNYDPQIQMKTFLDVEREMKYEKNQYNKIIKNT